ncbi:hypothetical protein HDZ31DRAFT_86211 [Schizophyllum fasciatum]
MTAPTLFDLTGRVAIVTGGGSDIGLTIARGFAANGADVYTTGRRTEVLATAANAFEGKGSLLPLPLDVTDKSSILHAKDTIAATDGHLDILVNNAGQPGPCSFWMCDDLFAVNAYPAFFVTSAFIGLLAKGATEHGAYSASVINVTSMCATVKIALSHFAYSAAKAAASHLTRMFATELARRKIPIRVNAIAPGIWETEMTRDLLADMGLDRLAQGLQPIPHGRPGAANEMAGTAVWMASATGGYLNGQEVVVDGGYTVVNPASR